MKKALITGITGQDGSYLAELLLGKNYEVHGIIRRSSNFNTWRINHLYQDPHEKQRRLILHYGDLTDMTSLMRIVKSVMPHEIYNLGAQSHVQVSFETPEQTGNIDALGTLRLLETIRILGLERRTRFYQASTSELYGKVKETPQNENTPFNPQSPYAAAKLYAFHLTKMYRKAYGMFASNGILFNHESPRRGQTFVTRKVSVGLCNVKAEKQDKLFIGNLDAKRDWGDAEDYVKAMWLMLQQANPHDYVIATGESHTVRELVEEVGRNLDIDIEWQGCGVDEKGIDRNTGKTVVEIDSRYLRPLEVDVLQGDPSKAQRELRWKAETSFKDLIGKIVKSDFERVMGGTLLY